MAKALNVDRGESNILHLIYDCEELFELTRVPRGGDILGKE